MSNLYPFLNAEKALIWRIVHRDNLTWILDNGLHSENSDVRSPNYVNIGNTELIDKRRRHEVPIAPGGTLADYVPFYFTPFSVMMKNIRSGRNVKQRENEEIFILVSNLHHVCKLGLSFVFTNAHAYLDWTNYYSDILQLDKIDWLLLQRRDFKREDEDPRKMERYQAEALIFRHLPIQGLHSIICYNKILQQTIEQQLQKRALTLSVYVKPEWYFP